MTTYISLTDFVDVVSKAGSPKATKVSQIKNRDKYSPAVDFYKALRERIIDIHKKNEPKAALHNILANLSDEKKLANYPSAIEGYNKWWGKKKLSWFTPPTTVFAKHGFSIGINPELGLEINGESHVIKLYLKEEKLTKFRVDLITSLMRHMFPSTTNPASMCILDVRNAKLFTSPPNPDALIPLIEAELSYMASLCVQLCKNTFWIN